jgi:hypothetical protein
MDFRAAMSSTFSSSLLVWWSLRNVTNTSVTKTFDEGPSLLTSSFCNAAYGAGRVDWVLNAQHTNSGNVTWGGGAPSRIDSQLSVVYASVSPSSAFSITSFYSPVAVHNSNQVEPLAGKGGAAGVAGWWFGKRSVAGNFYDHLFFGFSGTAGGAFLQYSATIECFGVGSVNPMVPVGMSYDGLATTASVVFYLNGYVIASGGLNMNVVSGNGFTTATNVSSSLPFSLGHNGTNYAYGGQGETTIWSRVLSASEFKQIASYEQTISSGTGLTGSYPNANIQHITVQLPLRNTVPVASASSGGGNDPRATKVNPGVN